MREPLIDVMVEGIVGQFIRTAIGEKAGIVHAIGFMPDHVHACISIPPSVAISDVVKRIKDSSAHAVNQAMPSRSFAWQPEYDVFSFSEKNLPDVVRYIENQRERHGADRLWPMLERINPDA